MRDWYLRGALPESATPGQLAVLAAYVAAGGSVPRAAARVGPIIAVVVPGPSAELGATTQAISIRRPR